ncbi:MAG: 50S ribosomal protein L20, partial [Prevotella sp.]|nr:50S ribosomal protein L20 [Prevotella sp.]
MPRSVYHGASKARRTRILKLTKGYFGARKNVWTVAKNTYEKGLT